MPETERRRWRKQQPQKLGSHLVLREQGEAQSLSGNPEVATYGGRRVLPTPDFTDHRSHANVAGPRKALPYTHVFKTSP